MAGFMKFADNDVRELVEDDTLVFADGGTDDAELDFAAADGGTEGSSRLFVGNLSFDNTSDGASEVPAWQDGTSSTLLLSEGLLLS
jgi:hypothetical protein